MRRDTRAAESVPAPPVRKDQPGRDFLQQLPSQLAVPAARSQVVLERRLVLDEQLFGEDVAHGLLRVRTRQVIIWPVTVTLRSLLQDGRVHVFDGAMGTMLYGKGFFLNVCYDELNLKQPRLVQEVHAEYVRAGAEVLETNTFGANPLKLNSYGLA